MNKEKLFSILGAAWLVGVFFIYIFLVILPKLRGQI